MAHEEEFDGEAFMRQMGESVRDEMRALAIEHGLDPDRMVASIKLYAFIGPDPVEPDWKE